MENLIGLLNNNDIESRILSITKQKSFVVRLKHRLEMRLENETRNGKKTQYIKRLISSCDDKIIEFEATLKKLKALKLYQSNFKIA